MKSFSNGKIKTFSAYTEVYNAVLIVAAGEEFNDRFVFNRPPYQEATNIESTSSDRWRSRPLSEVSSRDYHLAERGVVSGSDTFVP